MKRIKDYISTIIFLGTLGYGVTLLSQEPPRARINQARPQYFKNLFKEAGMFKDAMEGAKTQEEKIHFFNEAIARYNEIINTEQPINQNFRFKVMVHVAEMLVKESLKNPNQQHIMQSRRMLNKVVESQQNKVNMDTWAKAYTILAKMDEQGMGLPQKNPADAAQDFNKIFQNKSLLSSIAIFEATLLYTKLIYQHPEISSSPGSDIIKLYNEMMAEFYTFAPEEQELYSDEFKAFYDGLLGYAQSIVQEANGQKTVDIITPVIRQLAQNQPTLHGALFKCYLILYNLIARKPGQAPGQSLFFSYNKLVNSYQQLSDSEKSRLIEDIKDFNDSRLEFAQKLYNGSIHPENQPNFPETAKIYAQIIAAGDAQTNPTTLNKARVNLAGMYLRGEGVPQNTSNPQNVALELYKKVAEQPEANVFPEDRTRAQLAINLQRTRQERQEALARRQEVQQEQRKKQRTEKK